MLPRLRLSDNKQLSLMLFKIWEKNRSIDENRTKEIVLCLEKIQEKHLAIRPTHSEATCP